MRRIVLRMLLLASLVGMAGCGDVQKSAQVGPTTASAYPDAPVMAESQPLASAVGGKEIAATAPPGANRKIIFNARIDLVVENFDDAPATLAALVKKCDGYVADSNLSGSTGANRSGTWKVRVPVARFDEFISAAKGIGELVSASTQSQDVSDEFYDVDARIRNKTKEEERLLKLLEDRPGKLEDVISIERELSRVRDEVERMQGRLRVLTDLSSLTTVDISIREIQDYQPPQSPTFATRIGRAFSGSTTMLNSAFEGTVITVVALAPWIAVGGIALGIVYGGVRTSRRRRP